MPSERILTVPRDEAPGEPCLVTGNEFVALPELRRRDAALLSLNVLHRAARGLIEWTGEAAGAAPAGAAPLLQPCLSIAGEPVDLATNVQAGCVDHWLPEWRGHAAGVALQLRWYAPPGYRGCVFAWGLRNMKAAPIAVEAGLRGHLGTAYATVFHRRPLEGARALRPYPWTGSLVAEVVPGLPALALAIKTLPEPAVLEAAAARCANHEPVLLTLKVAHRLTLAPGEERWLPFYLSVGTEADGAATAGIDLARRGHAALWEESRSTLQRMHRPLADPALSACLHRNLFFNYYFARGRTLDSEEEVLVTSRSPRYYVSAAHWNRDSLLWSLPGLLLADPAAARSALLAAFRLYARNAGTHACYLDGAVLYPGFELDQLAAFPIALGRYLQATGDWSLVGEPPVAAALAEWEGRLRAQKHPQLTLYRTFLLPSDDPAQYPYVTYDNALAWAALQILAAIFGRAVGPAAAQPIVVAAQRLRAELYQHAVVSGPFGPMFAWAFEPGGDHVLYDEPSGSLALLPHYGFCTADDPVYRSTLAWIHSAHNPHYLSQGRFAGPACPHAPRSAWVLAMATDLLAGHDRERLLELVKAAPMDGGLACESIDCESGELRTGAAFATCAGFLAAAIWAAAPHGAT